MTATNDIDFEELLNRLDGVTKSLVDAPLERYLGDAKDVARQIEVTLDTKIEAANQELAELQAEYSWLHAKESELATELEASTRELEDASSSKRVMLESSIREDEEATRALQEEISRLKSELDKYDTGDMTAGDPACLQLLIYRGLGIRMLQGEDGTFSRIRLTSDDNRHTHEYRAKDYTPYFVAKHIWDYIAIQEE